MVERLVGGITPRTKVVALTWVHSSTGVRVPVAEICAALDGLSRVPRDQYVVCVDGVHGFSAVDVDLPDLGCDFLAAGTHKWLFGPRGTGILWGRDFGPADRGDPDLLRPRRAPPPGSPPAATTPSSTAGRSRTRSSSWATIGRDRIVARTAEQATQLKEGLAGIDGSPSVTPMSTRRLRRHRLLRRRRPAAAGTPSSSCATQGVVASATPYATSYLRLGPSIATTPEQVDPAIEAVSSLV